LQTTQAAEIRAETTTAVAVADHLALSTYTYEDPYPDWHNPKPFEPMLRAIVLGRPAVGASSAIRNASQWLTLEPP